MYQRVRVGTIDRVNVGDGVVVLVLDGVNERTIRVSDAVCVITGVRVGVRDTSALNNPDPNVVIVPSRCMTTVFTLAAATITASTISTGKLRTPKFVVPQPTMLPSRVSATEYS